MTGEVWAVVAVVVSVVTTGVALFVAILMQGSALGGRIDGLGARIDKQGERIDTLRSDLSGKIEALGDPKQ